MARYVFRIRISLPEALLAVDQQAHDLPGGDGRPMVRSCATKSLFEWV